MRRILLALVGALGLTVAAFAGYVYYQAGRIDSETVVDGVYMLRGLGGNVGVLRTERGPVVVDSMTFVMQGDRIRERAEALGGGPVQAVINTHYHGDHTHGNPAFAAETDVFATRRTLEHLHALDAEFWTGEAGERLPNRTFDEVEVIEIGGETIELHHLGRGHTDGDLVVLFKERKVLHTGDLVFNRQYPNIDLEAGGSIEAWSATIERMLELDFEHVIPGHGDVTDKAGVREFQRFIEDLWRVGERAAAEGWTLEQAQASADLQADADFAAIEVPFILTLDRAFVLRRAYEEATGTVLPYDAREARE